MKKNILITAGSTWVKIDEVRVLTNRFTGRTGLELARELQKAGYNVTVLANPHCVSKELSGLNVVEFFYYDEFKTAVERLLNQQKFDAVIHTAAVSDYYLPDPGKSKIASGMEELVLRLKPTEKIVKIMRRLAPYALLIQFKLENDTEGLIDKAYKSLQDNDSDFVVANALDNITQKYMISREKSMFVFDSLPKLAFGIDHVVRLLSLKK